jgi:hypothetical protein
MSSLESLKNRNSRSRPDILASILELHQQCLDKSLKVTLVWCPAHVNISGNEQADRGAKEGLLRGTVDAGEPLAPTEIYSLTKKFVVGEWSLRTDNLSSRRHTFNRPAKTLRPPDRYSASIVLDRAITRLRMGTTLLPGGAGKYVLGIDPACPRCQEPLTAPHMLLHCPNHKVQRDHLEAALHSHGLVLNLTNVLDPKGAARGPVFSALAKYLLDCQITDKI